MFFLVIVETSNLTQVLLRLIVTSSVVADSPARYIGCVDSCYWSRALLRSLLVSSVFFLSSLLGVSAFSDLEECEGADDFDFWGLDLESSVLESRIKEPWVYTLASLV